MLYADALYDDMTALVEVAYKDAARLLDVTSSFDVPPKWALEHVREAADHVASLIDERDRAALTTVLEDALTEGLSAADTAQRLHDAFDVIATPERTTRSDAWFDTVARTELQQAANDGQRALYEAAGIQTVRWQAAEPCDECAAYDDEVYALDDVPEGGPPIHPNCRCVLVPMDEDLGDHRGSAEDRAAARRGNQPDDTEE
ncbi:MAG: phage putative head morphosis protein family [Candidatus Eremiobacteraeota bacterium]|nr:phage putative head morphosis protein family [Candidatus Eremiobacteraeota bacterium]